MRFAGLQEGKKVRKAKRKISHPVIVENHQSNPSSTGSSTSSRGRHSDELLEHESEVTLVDSYHGYYQLPDDSGPSENNCSTEFYLNKSGLGDYHQFTDSEQAAGVIPMTSDPYALYLDDAIYDDAWVLPEASNPDGLTALPSTRGNLESEEHVSIASSYFSISSMKRRLEATGCAEHDIETIVRLLKGHSIADSSAATSRTSVDTINVNSQSNTAAELYNHSELSVEYELESTILPGTLLKFKLEEDREAGSFAANPRWRDVVREVNNATGVLSLWTTVSRQFVRDPSFALFIHVTDAFGNTFLHLLAVRGSPISAMRTAIRQGLNPNSKNMGGQNFLHLLPSEFFSLMEEQALGLAAALDELQSLGASFEDRDVLGRNFYHILESGYCNVVEPSPEVETASLLGCDRRQSTASTIRPFPCTSEDEILRHTKLIHIARAAMEGPDIENDNGQNGLQCLAEASFDIESAAQKRKRDEDTRQRMSTIGESESSWSRGLELRYEWMQQLICRGVDINHHDRNGDTVLMTFVRYLEDGKDDKLVKMLLNHLILNGANIHSRNQLGETALHISVRLGRKKATETLLENGANVHVRTSDGKGIIALAEKVYYKSKKGKQPYSSVMACVALVNQYGAVPTPTVVQEWSENEGFAKWLMLQRSLRMQKAIELSKNRVEAYQRRRARPHVIVKSLRAT